MFKSIRVAGGKGAKGTRTVIGVFADDRAARTPKEFKARADAAGFKAEVGESFAPDETHLLLGLGKAEKLSLDVLRKAGGGLVKVLDRMNATAAAFALRDEVPDRVGDEAAIHSALAEGVGLANFRVDFFDGKATNRQAPRGALTLSASSAAARKGIERGLALADSANYARRLAATPPNICNPTFMAKEARRLAKEKGLACTVIDFNKAKSLGMGGLVNVGKASEHKPCLIQLEYTPPKATKKTKTIAIVGKTITYDTGGYSLKISNGMKGMKYDKCGGMAVIGTMHAVASLKPACRVVAYLPCAENMVSGDAYRPDDIIEMHNGVSVEVTNTDAEGRLVLADALAYACNKSKPDAVVDLATLTGGVVVALGAWCAGFFCNDDALRRRVLDASRSTGEKVWELPLWDEHREFMRAKHADIWNSGPKRDGHPIQGAAFLSYFVPEGVPWAHIDIAGVSNVDSDTELFVVGPTGYGVRLMADLIENFANEP